MFFLLIKKKKLNTRNDENVNRTAVFYMMVLNIHTPEEGRNEMFYLTTHSTHFYLRLYGVRHMVKDHSDS